jgi:DNA processing protein
MPPAGAPVADGDGLSDWVALIAAPGIGSRGASALLGRFGGPAAIRGAPTESLREAGLKADAIAALRQPDPAVIAGVLAWAGQPNAHVLTRLDPRYPMLLAETPDPPPVLFVRGDPALLGEPQIAIVGSRNPTPTGLAVARELARGLAACGLVITSGLAAGIDGAAHAGALETGRTVAVLGTGPDRVYPAAHRDLARAIAESGALVSELLPGAGPLARHFPRRNRIIAGLALGTLVAEAAPGSGSLITARQALEQGREVFAVPGSVRNPLARGCHALLREGARLVEEPADVLAELAPRLQGLLADTAAAAVPARTPGDPPADLAADYRALLEAMGYDPVAPDELVRRLGRPVEELSSMLLVLELEGHVSSSPGGRYCRLAG